MVSEQPALLVIVLKTPIVTFVPQQLSSAVGASNSQASPQVTVLLAAAQVRAGGVVSTIVTVWLQVLVWPQQSVACQVRVTAIEQPLPLVTVLTTLMVMLVRQQS